MGRRLPYPITRSQRGVKPNQRQRGWALEVFQRNYYCFCYRSQQTLQFSSRCTPRTPNCQSPHAPYAPCVPLPSGSLFDSPFPSKCRATGKFVFFNPLCLSSKRLVEWLYGRDVFWTILGARQCIILSCDIHSKSYINLQILLIDIATSKTFYLEFQPPTFIFCSQWSIYVFVETSGRKRWDRFREAWLNDGMDSGSRLRVVWSSDVLS